MSVVVDRMTHMPIALLEDRNGEALDNWLTRNPQIQYITRDRGGCFTEAINRIIPGAVSYTHLDVYKRQNINRVGHFFRKCTGNRCEKHIVGRIYLLAVHFDIIEF